MSSIWCWNILFLHCLRMMSSSDFKWCRTYCAEAFKFCMLCWMMSNMFCWNAVFLYCCVKWCRAGAVETLGVYVSCVKRCRASVATLFYNMSEWCRAYCLDTQCFIVFSMEVEERFRVKSNILCTVTNTLFSKLNIFRFCLEKCLREKIFEWISVCRIFFLDGKVFAG